MESWGAMDANRTECCGIVCGLIPLPSRSQVKNPVCCLPRKPLPGPDMKRLWQVFVLCVFWGFILWLMAPCLDQKPELEPQEKLTYLVPRRCSCLWLKFRKCGCLSGTLNYTLCHPTVKEQNWFAACYEKTMGYLMGATDSMIPDAVLQWLVSGQHWAQSHPLSFLGLAHVPLSGPKPCLWLLLSAPPIFTASAPDLPTEISTPQVFPAPSLLPPAVSRA